MPTAATIPNSTVRVPPITGSGMRDRTAPNFPITPHTTRMTPAVKNAARLATYTTRQVFLNL